MGSKTKPDKLGQAERLRKSAEERLKKSKAKSEVFGDTQKLIHELQVHQIELEMQNEELRRARQELQASRDNYFDFYNFSPVGYFTFDEKGLILDLNLTSATFLCMERQKLISKNFLTYISPDSRPSFNAFCQKAQETDTKQTCELKLNASAHVVFIEGTSVPDEAGRGNRIRAIMFDITGRKQVEGALWESEERYRNLFENNHAVMLLIDPDNAAIMDANPAACTYYGWSREELMKRKIDEINTLSSEEVAAAMQLARSERGAQFFFKHRRADDTIRDVEVYSGPILLKGKTLLYSIIHDITERKQADKALIESEDRYRIAIEHSNDGVAIVRGDNHIFVNKRFLEIFGYEHAEEVVGQPISFTVHPDDRERVVSYNRQRQKNEPVPSLYEMKGMKKDGEVVYIEVSATNVPFHGEPASLAYFRDITNRKQREKKLAEDVEKITLAKQEWESLVDSLSELVLLLDEKGDIIRSNKGMECWNLGHPINIKGQTPHDILHPYCTAFDCYLKVFISNGLKDSAAGKPLELEVKDEVCKRYLDIRMRPIRTQQKGANHINGSFAVLVIHDITERMQARESLSEAYDELKDAQQELIQIEKLALLGKFSSGIAHEIRNPLANICASAQFCLAKYELDEEIKKHLRIMLRNSEHANKIIKDLIDLSKPSEVSLEPGDISDLINSICDLIKTRCEKQHILLHKKISRRLPHILMDKERVEKAFLNFVINAIEAMPKGGKLAVNAYPYFDKGQVIINILDTGKGIPQEDFDKIFHPFFTTKRTGIGLGLCLADQVISSHKGRLSINSTVGKGTEITIKLPISGGGEAKRIDADG